MRPSSGIRGALFAALVFACVTPWALRPWFTAADQFPRYEGSAGAMADADLYLNVWILAWAAHAVVHEPARLFGGNVFHPAESALTGSENMFAHLPFTVPVQEATGNALHVLKAMVLESFVLAGLGMWLLVWYHTRDPVAALVAGMVYTFAPYRPRTVPEPQYLGTAWLPLALLATDVWLANRRLRALAGLALAIALQVTSCSYVGYFTLVVVPVYALARVVFARSAAPVAALGGVAAGLVAGVALVVPVAMPYLRARAAGVIPVHDLVLVAAYSWPPWIYLTPVIAAWSGAVPLVLVAGDVLSRTVARIARVHRPVFAPEAATWALALTGAILSAGPWFTLPGGTRVPLPYWLFYALVPGFSAMRAPVRFFVVVLAALAALAGYAFARWTSGAPRVLRAAFAAACLTVAAWQAAPEPAAVMPARLGRFAPGVYRRLAEATEPGAVVEVPGWKVQGDIVGNLRNGRSMVASTIGWWRLVNGYTAYPPPSASLQAAAIRRLPNDAALQLLVDTTDVRWLVVHRADLHGTEFRQWNDVTTPGLERVATFGTDDLYRITRPLAHDWRSALLAPPEGRSFAGVPTTPLAEPCRAARLVSMEPPKALAPSPFPIPFPVRFANDSDCTWPAVHVDPEGLVGLTYRWTDPTGKSFPDGAFTRLVADVLPGATVDDTMLVFPPGGPYGPWRLDVMLVQRGLERPLAEATATVELRRWPTRLAPPAG